MKTEPLTASKFRAKALVFDLDGTLVHSGPDLAVAANRMLGSMGLPQHEERVVFDWLGNGATRLVQRALTGDADGYPDEALFQRGYELFMAYYREGLCVKSAPFPHVERVLEEFRGDANLWHTIHLCAGVHGAHGCLIDHSLEGEKCTGPAAIAEALGYRDDWSGGATAAR